PFRASTARQPLRLGPAIGVMPRVASKGSARSAEGGSMAAPLGSLAMLLESRALGAVVDLDRLPVPADTDPIRWMLSFPTYAFWLTADPETAAECIAEFHSADLECVEVGTVTRGSELRLRYGGDEAMLLDFAAESVTGLWRGDELDDPS